MYADYGFYRDIYGGTLIPQEDFEKRSFQASVYIDEMTFSRLKNGWPVTEEVQYACCSVAETIQEYSNQETRLSAVGVKSENVDGYSVTYEDPAQLRQSFKNTKLDALAIYIPSSHPLRYAGGDP